MNKFKSPPPVKALRSSPLLLRSLRPDFRLQGYWSNLLDKLNLKALGTNYYPLCEVPGGGLQPGLQLLRECPTLLLGCDVHHAAPGSSRPSYGALVGTVDKFFSSHYTEVRAMTGRQECIPVDDMESMVREQLQAFYRYNGIPPQRIICYRDGVAHNQFEEVHEVEIHAIERACHAIEQGYQPQIVFIVEQKGGGARFFANENGRVPGQQMGNQPPLTVVDTVVVDESTFSFHLTPHHGMKGTSRGNLYSVLRNDPNLSSDDLQRFTSQLCHLFQRCKKIVSKVAPNYNAHLAAEMWGLKEERESFSDTASVSSDAAACDVHERLKTRLFYT